MNQRKISKSKILQAAKKQKIKDQLQQRIQDINNVKLTKLKQIDENTQKVRIVFENDDIYEGELKNQKIHGKGKLKWKNQDIYEGEFYNGLRSGYGKFISSNFKCSYQGQWKLGLRHGIGKLEFQNGSYYEGYFYLGKKQGKGIYYYQSGNYYLGDWNNEQKEGFGKMYWIDKGETYKGYWKDNMPHGVGEQQWKEESGNLKIFNNKYCGFFNEGKREGLGVFYYSNGEIYIGEWQNDKKNGYGILINQFGQEIQQFYIENDLPELYEQKVREMNDIEKKNSQQQNLIKKSFGQKYITQSRQTPRQNQILKQSMNRLQKEQKELTQTIQQKEVIVTNIYKNILKLKSIFKYLPQKVNFENLNENLYVLLIRQNRDIKNLFQYFKYVNKEKKVSKNTFAMYLKDFESFVEESSFKSPFWHFQTFSKFFIENQRNIIQEGFNFECHFKQIIQIIEKNVGYLCNQVYQDLSQYYEFKYKHLQKINFSDFQKSFQNYKQNYQQQEETKFKILGEYQEQLSNLSHKSQTLLKQRQLVLFYNFIDLIIRYVLFVNDYDFQNLESNISDFITSLKQNFFKSKMISCQSMLKSAITQEYKMEEKKKQSRFLQQENLLENLKNQKPQIVEDQLEKQIKTVMSSNLFVNQNLYVTNQVQNLQSQNKLTLIILLQDLQKIELLQSQEDFNMIIKLYQREFDDRFKLDKQLSDTKYQQHSSEASIHSIIEEQQFAQQKKYKEKQNQKKLNIQLFSFMNNKKLNFVLNCFLQIQCKTLNYKKQEIIKNKKTLKTPRVLKLKQYKQKNLIKVIDKSEEELNIINKNQIKREKENQKVMKRIRLQQEKDKVLELKRLAKLQKKMEKEATKNKQGQQVKLNQKFLIHFMSMFICNFFPLRFLGFGLFNNFNLPYISFNLFCLCSSSSFLQSISYSKFNFLLARFVHSYNRFFELIQ